MTELEEHAERVARWRAIHREAGDDDLDAVCHHDAPKWFNAYAEREQQRAFAEAFARVGDLRGKDVFELGCGRARWTRTLHAEGAHVHAVDVSEEAIARNASKLPGVRFEAGDFLELELPAAAYDVALSITVVQHITHGRQDEAVARLAKLLRAGGHAVLLESLRVGPLTYGRPLDDWLALFARHGLTPQHVRGYAFALPLRAVQSLVSRARAGTGATTEQPEPTNRSTARAAYWTLGIRPAVALSALTEGAARRLLPSSAATHGAFVLVRES